MARNEQSSQPKSQVERFKEAARELGTDDREEAFDEKLRRVARSPRPADDADHVKGDNTKGKRQ